MSPKLRDVIMTHVVSGKLFKPAFIKNLGESTMFAIKLSEVTKDRQTGEKAYTNYEAVLFAKTQGQIDFYTQATAEGSFVVVSCEKLQIKVSECGQYTKLSMENARLENANYTQSQPAQHAPQNQAIQRTNAPQPAAPAYNQQPTQHQQPNPNMDFDDGIPF